MLSGRLVFMSLAMILILTPSIFLPRSSHYARLQAADGESANNSPEWHRQFVEEIFPLLRQQCSECHWSDREVEAGVELDRLAEPDQTLEQHRLVGSMVRVLTAGEMPPDQAWSESDIQRVVNWYETSFRPALKSLPGPLMPRRLSRHELRYSLAVVFGFDLEVAVIEAEQTVVEKSLVLKLLPEDPPGKSGFTNDTQGNPLSESQWEQIAAIVDSGIETLLGPSRHLLLSRFLQTEFDPDSQEALDRFRTITGGDAELILREIYRRAYRRPVPEPILGRAVERLQVSESVGLMERLRIEIKTAILSPAFLYRGLLARKPSVDVERHGSNTAVKSSGEIWECDDFELAERLSYFLWAETPDRELYHAASEGRLHQAADYRDQVERLLDDPRSIRLAELFAVEWLALSEIEKVSDNPPVANALYRQPIDYFDHLVREDRPIVEFYESDYTFANPHTARFYPGDRRKMSAYRKQRGIEVEAVKNEKLTLEQTPERGGILTMPGVLAMNRGAVTRGTWMLERILGIHLPEPPANVGQVPPSPPGEQLSFRERFELHRSQPSCKACHKYIDPLGFALERYARDGAFLSQKAAFEAKVDTSGVLPTGERFADFEELQKLLLREKSEGILRHLVERFLAYALCRELEWYDVKTVDQIVLSLSERGDGVRYLRHDATFRDLVRLVTESFPFTHARR
ncbi:MAG: DUF1592 domain-containing protein [Rubripirellula sp.]